MSRARVVVPSPTPASPMRLVAIGVAAFAVGVMLVRATLARPDHDEDRSAVTTTSTDGDDMHARATLDPERPATTVATPSAALEDAGRDRAVPDAGAGGRPPIVAPAATVETSPAPAPEANGAAGATFVQGRVAYLQCSGTEPQEGPYPCPRDLELEEAVWQTLRELTTCSPNVGTGFGDLRMDLERGTVTELRFRTPPSQPALPRTPLERCVGARLGALRTSLAMEGIVLSFRFELASAAP